MSAATGERLTTKFPNASDLVGSLPDGVSVAAGVKIWAGTMVSRNAAGYAVPTSADVTQIVLGVSATTVDNTTGADGAKFCQVRNGIWEHFVNNGSSIAQKDIYSYCYAVDNQTVDLSSAGNSRPIVGIIRGVDASGVVVEFGMDSSSIAQAINANESGSTRAVRGVVTANIASLAAFTVAGNDGITYVAGDRLLAVGQSTPSQNGIYLVGTVAIGVAPLTRPTDWATGLVIASALVTASEGTINKDSLWQITTDGNITVDTTAVAFEEIDQAPGASGIGNVLKVLATGKAGYGAVNLAGGANHVTGVLPQANGGTGLASPSVANIAALSLVNNALLATSTQIIVNSVLAPFMYDATSTQTVDSITCAATLTGTGRWLRLTQEHPKWTHNRAWFVNTVNSSSPGNDENDGFTSSTPLKTIAELTRRQIEVDLGLYVTIVDGDVDISDSLRFQPRFSSTAVFNAADGAREPTDYRIIAKYKNSVAGTFSGNPVVPVPASNTRGKIASATGASDFVVGKVVEAFATPNAPANISGAAGTIASVASGTVTFTGGAGFTTFNVGQYLKITGAATGANNGTFLITAFISATSVQYANPSAVAPDASNGAIGWAIQSAVRAWILNTTDPTLAAGEAYISEFIDPTFSNIGLGVNLVYPSSAAGGSLAYTVNDLTQFNPEFQYENTSDRFLLGWEKIQWTNFSHRPSCQEPRYTTCLFRATTPNSGANAAGVRFDAQGRANVTMLFGVCFFPNNIGLPASQLATLSHADGRQDFFGCAWINTQPLLAGPNTRVRYADPQFENSYFNGGRGSFTGTQAPLTSGMNGVWVICGIRGGGFWNIAAAVARSPVMVTKGVCVVVQQPMYGTNPLSTKFGAEVYNDGRLYVLTGVTNTVQGAPGSEIQFEGVSTWAPPQPPPVSVALVPAASIGANSTAEETFTVTGAVVGQSVGVSETTVAQTAGLGRVGARVTAANTVAIRWMNCTGGALTGAAENYIFDLKYIAQPLSTWAQWAAAPFAGQVVSVNTGAKIIRVTQPT